MQLQRRLLIPRPSVRSKGPPSEPPLVDPGPSIDPRASESQYQTIFDCYPHPTWILDRATLRFLAANRAAIERYGYSREELLVMSYPEIHLAEDEAELKPKLGQNGSSCGASH